jgi:hypothetical protein
MNGVYRGIPASINDEPSRQPLKGSQFLDTAEQKLSQGVSYLKDASKDREGIGDDLLRLAGGGLKNIGHVTNAPVIKQGLQLAGAVPWAAGQGIGAVLEHGFGVDPRYGHIAGELGDIAVGGGALKIGGKLARKGIKGVRTAKGTLGSLLEGGMTAHVGTGLKKTTLTAAEKSRLLKNTTVSRVGIARKYADDTDFVENLNKINKDVLEQGLENYKGPRTVKAPDGKTYKIETSGKTGSGKTSWRSQADANKYVEWRKETIPMITDKDLISKGNAKMKALNAKGLEGHHIVPLHVSRELMESMSPKQWVARKAADAKKGIFHGHDPRNIVGAKHSTRTPHKESDLWHRTGTPDSPGYHALEKQVDWVKEGLTPFRDKMVQQVKPGRQARYRKGLGKIKKTKPTQFPDKIQKHINRSQEIGITEPSWKDGSIDYIWRPQSNTGQIDIPPQSMKTFKGLRDEFFSQIENLPSGSVWELNPKFKDVKRRRIYARLFDSDKRITRNADETLGWVLKVP